MEKLMLIVSFVIFCIDCSQSQLSCRDENDKAVDWFIALKYPDSYSFDYLTPSIDQWKASSEDLSSPSNMVGLTLAQSYNRDYFYAYYNDEPAEKELLLNQYWKKGHLKGIVNFDKSGGYWLIHSVPKFPTKNHYEYLEGESRFGQSFICISVGAENLHNIVTQLLMMQPKVYSYNIPKDYTRDKALLRDINRFVNNRKTNSSRSNKLALTTSNQMNVLHFGKSGSFNQDLYANFIALSLETSMYVETWIRGDRIDSSCHRKYKVYNVERVRLPCQGFRETMDHSKWAVSTSADQPYVCIGDINRMTSQFKRGGGSMCLSNLNIWKTFRKVVDRYEECDQ